MDEFVVYEEDQEAMDRELRWFLENSGTKCVLLVHKSGQLITKQGFTHHLATDELAVLAAGAYAATKQIAMLLGETEFSVLFHQGEREHINFSLLDERTILLAIFDDRTSVGMVRLAAGQVAGRLRPVLERIATRRVADERAVRATPTGDLFAPEQS